VSESPFKPEPNPESIRVGYIVMTPDRKVMQVHRVEDGHLYGIEYGLGTRGCDGPELDAPADLVSIIATPLEEGPRDENECPHCGQMMRRA